MRITSVFVLVVLCQGSVLGQDPSPDLLASLSNLLRGTQQARNVSDTASTTDAPVISAISAKENSTDNTNWYDYYDSVDNNTDWFSNQVDNGTEISSSAEDAAAVVATTTASTTTSSDLNESLNKVSLLLVNLLQGNNVPSSTTQPSVATSTVPSEPNGTTTGNDTQTDALSNVNDVIGSNTLEVTSSQVISRSNLTTLSTSTETTSSFTEKLNLTEAASTTDAPVISAIPAKENSTDNTNWYDYYDSADNNTDWFSNQVDNGTETSSSAEDAVAVVATTTASTTTSSDLNESLNEVSLLLANLLQGNNVPSSTTQPSVATSTAPSEPNGTTTGNDTQTATDALSNINDVIGSNTLEVTSSQVISRSNLTTVSTSTETTSSFTEKLNLTEAVSTTDAPVISAIPAKENSTDNTNWYDYYDSADNNTDWYSNQVDNGTETSSSAEDAAAVVATTTASTTTSSDLNESLNKVSLLLANLLQGNNVPSSTTQPSVATSTVPSEPNGTTTGNDTQTATDALSSTDDVKHTTIVKVTTPLVTSHHTTAALDVASTNEMITDYKSDATEVLNATKVPNATLSTSTIAQRSPSVSQQSFVSEGTTLDAMSSDFSVTAGTSSSSVETRIEATSTSPATGSVSSDKISTTQSVQAANVQKGLTTTSSELRASTAGTQQRSATDRAGSPTTVHRSSNVAWSEPFNVETTQSDISFFATEPSSTGSSSVSTPGQTTGHSDLISSVTSLSTKAATSSWLTSTKTKLSVAADSAPSATSFATQATSSQHVTTTSLASNKPRTEVNTASNLDATTAERRSEISVSFQTATTTALRSLSREKASSAAETAAMKTTTTHVVSSTTSGPDAEVFIDDFSWILDGSDEDATPTIQTTSTETTFSTKSNKYPETIDIWKAVVPLYTTADERWDYNYIDHTTIAPPLVAVALTVATPSLFFKRNWLWVLLVVLAIVLLFLIPGLILQIYCHKYYLSYRREKKRKRRGLPDGSTSTEATENNEMVGLGNGGQPAVVSSQVAPSAYQPAPDVNSTPPAPGPQPFVVTIPESTQVVPVGSHPQPYRVDVYEGPCSLPTSHPIQSDPGQIFATVPRMQQPTVAQVGTSSLGQDVHLTSPRSGALPAVPHGPYGYPQHLPDVYSIPVKNEATNQDRNARTPAHAFGSWAKIANEAIVDGGRVRKGRHSSAQRPRLREPKPDRYKPPTRPPKPGQYQSDPVPKVEDYREQRRSARHSDRPWADSEQPAEKPIAPREPRRSKIEKVIVSNPRGNDHGPADSRKDARRDRKKNRKRSSSRGRQRDLQKREDLMRELIKGFNEAEMLQRKLDRTRRWTAEQSKRNGSRGRRREGEKKSNNRAGQSESRKRAPERPPKYEDVMSDNHRAEKSSRRDDADRRTKPKAR